MAARRSVYVPGLSHAGNPIPAASVVGGLLVSGGISGVDRNSEQLPEDAEGQTANALDNAVSVVEAAGGTANDIVKFVVYVRDKSLRATLNAAWETMFPDSESRPARHVLRYEDLPAGMLLQVEITAALTETS